MAISNPRPGGQSGFITPTGVETISNKTLGDSTKLEFEDVTIASNTFARPTGTAARITSGAGPLNSISGGINGNFLILENKSGADIDVANNVGAGGFITGTGGDVSLADDASLHLLYNSADDRWSVIGGTGSGAGEGSFSYVTNGKATSNVSTGVTVAASGFAVAKGTTEATFSDTYFDVSGTATSGKTIDWALEALNEKDDGKLMRFSANVKLVLGSGTGQPYKIGVHDGSSYVAGTEHTLIDGAATRIEKLFPLDRAATYTVRLEAITANGNADDDIYLDDIVIGPEQVVQSDGIMTDWADATVTGSWSTNTTYVAKKRRVGANAEYFIDVNCSGAPNATNLTITLDENLDTSILNDGGDPIQGSVIIDNAGTREYPAVIRYNGGNTISISYILEEDETNNRMRLANVTESQPFALGSGDQVRITCTVPVADWAGQSNFGANSRVEFLHNSSTATGADDTTSFNYGAGGASIVAISSANADVKKRVRAESDIGDSDKLLLEVSPGNSKWFAASELFPYMVDGAAKYGMKIENVANSTDIDVVFGGDGAFQGDAWSNYTSYKWRITKSANPLGIGAGLASSNDIGAVSTSAQSFAGNKTFDNNLAVTGTTTLTDDLAVDTNTLFVDASTDRVGIGTVSPGTALDVNGTITATGISLGNETLSNYDEGTFTPSLIGLTTGSVNGSGKYTRIGNRVDVKVSFANVSTSGFAGQMRVTGLPFTSANDGVNQAGSIWHDNVSTDLDDNRLSPMLDPNKDYIVFLNQDNLNAATWSAPGTGVYLRLSITYWI